MPFRFLATDPGERYDSNVINQMPRGYSLEDVIRQIGYSDVERLVNADTDQAFLEIAEQYAFFIGSQDPELMRDFEADAEQDIVKLARQRFFNSLGYRDMSRYMRLAIELSELLERVSLGIDDLLEVGIFIAEPPEGHKEMAREMGKSTSKMRSNAGMADPLVIDCEKNCATVAKPFYRCFIGASCSKSPYAEHLRQGMLHASKQDGLSFGLRETKYGFVFDILNDFFPDSPSGYRGAVSKTLETLFRINLWDMVVTVKDGYLTQAPRSVYAALWYQLARGMEGGRAMRCEACGKPLIAFGERGMKRKYCSEACKKWAQRNPGQQRKMRS